jgi:hypothetical protein
MPRAHRVRHIEMSPPSFNCEECPKLMEHFLCQNGKYVLNMEEEGLFKIPIEDMQKIIKESKELELSDTVLLQLASDINEALKKRDAYVTYYMF